VAWNPAQALAFLARVKARMGVMPGVYLNRSLMDGANWGPIAGFGAPLWIAYYNPSPPPIKWWSDWSVWQYTSTPLDRNKAQTPLGTAMLSAAPITANEEDMQLNALRNYDGSIGIIDDSGLLNPLTSEGEWNSYLRIGIVKQQADGSYWIQQSDGTVWNALTAITARVNAQRAGDPKALAQATSALIVPAVIAALQSNGATALTQDQVQAAAEAAIKDVFAAAAS
jgi:hypothetical protein